MAASQTVRTSTTMLLAPVYDLVPVARAGSLIFGSGRRRCRTTDVQLSGEAFNPR
ncbi:hypothetical protein LWF15_12270 [Kineosporia rhizophila]|uniref:hypothetical protein n=1 Tax=Kineosporia TaxID=49184 RepID=UPI000ABE050B|nr:MULTISPECIES: hypothetical protein [Kineosporia]MCE0536284.1 hypothetical protein [Kineosporia rhizophila]